MQNHRLDDQLQQKLEEQLVKEQSQKIGTTLFLYRKYTNHILNLIDKRLYSSIAHARVPIVTLNSLLKYGAYGQPQQVKAMLEENPELLLQRGDAIDPAGNKIRGVTVYELALGAGDNEIVDMMRPYFDKFEGGIAALKNKKKITKMPSIICWIYQSNLLILMNCCRLF